MGVIEYKKKKILLNLSAVLFSDIKRVSFSEIFFNNFFEFLANNNNNRSLIKQSTREKINDW